MKFHNKKFAEEYERRLNQEGYPGELLTIVERELRGCSTILDIGAGSGFFSVPLAESGYFVTAIEPALPMITIMKKKIRGKTGINLAIEQSEWLQWTGNHADRAICIHAVYPMEDKKRSIEKMKEYAEKTVLLVRSPEKTRSMTDIIRNELNIDNYRNQQNTDTIRNALKAHGIPYQEREILVRRKIVFTDLYSEWQHYQFHLSIDDEYESDVKRIIEHHSSRSGNGYTFTADHYDIVFTF